MKTFPAGLQEHLDSGATTMCWCWRVARNDGTVQGFTDHDEPVVFGGVTYEAAAGIAASELQSTLGLAVDNLSVAGARLDGAPMLSGGNTISQWFQNGVADVDYVLTFVATFSDGQIEPVEAGMPVRRYL